MLTRLTLDLMSFGLTPVLVSFLVCHMKNLHSIRSPQDLGVLLAQARKRRGQSQRQLAADFGVSQAWISRVEKGYQKTWIGQVFRLAVYLGVELTAGQTGDDRAENASKARADSYPDLNQLV